MKKEMHKRNHVKDVVLPHSKAKLDLFKTYLEHYLRVLSLAPFCTKINLYDIFCGIGLYKDGNVGSPLIAVDRIKETHKLLNELGKPIKQINLTINDKEKDKIETVRKLLLEQKLNQTSYFYHNEDADDMLDFVSNEVNSFPSTERNLVFIDPYGYSNIHKEKIQKLLKNENTEIILFLPVMQMYRFKNIALTDSERTCYDDLRRFIFSFFPSNHRIHNDQIENIFDFINEIKEALSFNGKFFTSSHYIQRDSGNYYALFYITPSLYGLDKMVETKWHVSPVTGKGFNQTKNQQSLFEQQFQEQDQRQQIEYLNGRIIEAIKSSENGLSNKDIYLLTLKSDFKPSHANGILKALIKNNQIKVYDAIGNKVNVDFGLGISYKEYKEKNIKVLFKNK